MKTPKIIYVDMDDTILHYSAAVKEAIERNPGIKFPQSQLDFFRNLKPINGAINAMQELDACSEYEVYILTAPSRLNPLCYMEKRIWVEQHLGMEFVPKLIISMNKGLFKGDYLIDDWTKGRGQENFEGELIHFGSNQFPDWQAIQDYLNH